MRPAVFLSFLLLVAAAPATQPTTRPADRAWEKLPKAQQEQGLKVAEFWSKNIALPMRLLGEDAKHGFPRPRDPRDVAELDKPINAAMKLQEPDLYVVATCLRTDCATFRRWLERTQRAWMAEMSPGNHELFKAAANEAAGSYKWQYGRTTELQAQLEAKYQRRLEDITVVLP